MTTLDVVGRRERAPALLQVMFFLNMIALLAVCAIPNAYKFFIVEIVAAIDVVVWAAFFAIRLPRWVVTSFALISLMFALVVTTALLSERALYYTLRQSAFMLYIFQGLVLLCITFHVSAKNRWRAGVVVYLASMLNVLATISIQALRDPNAYPSLSALLWLMIFAPALWQLGEIPGKALAIVGVALAVYGSAHLSYLLGLIVMIGAATLHALFVRRALLFFLAALLVSALASVGGAYYIWDVMRHTDANISLRSILYVETLRGMNARELIVGRGVGVPYFSDLVAQYVVRQIGTAQEGYEKSSMTLTLHSSFLTTFFHVGSVGLALYLFVLGKMTALQRLVQRRADAFGVATCVGALGGLTHGAFNQFFEAPYHAFPFFCLVALGASSAVLGERASEEDKSTARRPATFRNPSRHVASRAGPSDLPLIFHSARTRVSTVITPCGAV